MLLSARGAARVLAKAGVARTEAQLLLTSGLAGRAMRVAGAVLYEERAVRALRRPIPRRPGSPGDGVPTRPVHGSSCPRSTPSPLGGNTLRARRQGADAVRAPIATDGRIAFEFGPPAPWFRVLVDRVPPTSRGGRPWVVWTPRGW